ncbi:hypothetical protein Y032_0007g3569 [Ancylostoma ceylanicum]|uniref:G-protein coupled receptors family 1 profile domain-containing protein n=1 Tax=Ancylostoma ceylanicum TaxID=53326 RepID=A0A016VPX5_9BILA|nr:hypothetical protein Y032_0007g3569 [Ancylostoma ceylanicum]
MNWRIIILDDANFKQTIDKKYTIIPASLRDSETVLIDCRVSACKLSLSILGSCLAVGAVAIVLMVSYSYYYLRSQSVHLSSRTIRLQKTFLLLLLIQVSVHTVAFLIPVTVLMSSYWLTASQDLVNACVYLVSVNGTAGTLTMLITTRFYRREVIRIILMLRKKTQSAIVQPTTVMSISNSNREQSLRNNRRNLTTCFHMKNKQ